MHATPIRKLDSFISKQIAAGEVVENPSSVVKELVENSLDAGAKRIRITFRRGGLKEITVVDDGCGIPANQINLALERHATSKITFLKDLQEIQTLGFRGEALPSIASVSKMSVSTCHQDETVGRYVFCEGGKEIENKEIGFPVGTKITVKDLFYNTPVRLKFLKGIPSETAKLTRIINILALSRPDVSFLLLRKNEVLLEIPGDGNLLSVITKIFGSDFARELVPISFESEDVTLNGYVSNPNFSRNSRHYQIFYINGRYVRSQLIREALDRSFASIVTSKRYPAAFLHLTLPPGNLDVNVHPSKTEVRFHRENQMRSFLEQNLKTAFSPKYFIHEAKHRKDSMLPMDKKKNVYNYDLKDDLKAPPKYDQIYDHSYENHHEDNMQIRIAEHKSNFEDNIITGSNVKTELFTGKIFNGSVIGQVFSTYIIMQKDDDLILLDQHAAHERILWEKIKLKENKKGKYVQEILPTPVELPLTIAETIKEKELKLLQSLGLEVEQFGNNTFIIRTVPFFLKNIFTAEILRDILEEASGTALTSKDFEKDTLLRISCKAAIKANKNLAIDEIKSLLIQLNKCDNPYFCPHGRPVAVKLKKSEIEKHFKRRG